MKYQIHRIFLFFFASFLLLNNLLYPQSENLKFECISIEQGLSQSTVNCIYQDSRGFLWFSTQDGLNKYDGYSFTVFKSEPADSTSPSDNDFLTIAEDNSGNLWLGTEVGGINKYDYKTGKFIHYMHDPNNSNSISSNYINVIYKDKTGLLWIGTQNGGLDSFDPKTEKFQHYKFNPSNSNSISNNNIYSIRQDVNGYLWIATQNGLNRYDKSTGTFTRYYLDKYVRTNKSAVTVLSLCVDRKGLLWLGTSGEGLISFDQTHNKFNRFINKRQNDYSISGNIIKSIFEDSEGRLWIGTENGLNEFDRSKNIFYCFQKNLLDPVSISNNNIISICEDKSSNLWIGTVVGGVNKLVREREKFTHIKNPYNSPSGLSDNDVFSFCEDKYGNLWIGTYLGGINKWNRKTNKFTRYTNSPWNYNSISSNKVWAIITDEPDYLWIATDNGLDKLNIRTNRFTHYKHSKNNPFSLGVDDINSLVIDKTGNLWIGTWGGGIDYYDKASNKFYHLKHIPGNSNSVAENRILALIQDKSGNLWIGTWNGGLDKYDPLTKKFYHYTYNKKDPNSINSNSIMSLHEDINGKFIWVGTSDGGLNKLDIKTGKFTHYTEKDGLPNNLVYGILNDDEGNLWLSTNKGICKFDPAKNLFKYFNIKNGLQSNEFNQNAYYKNKKGELFFGGVNGFNVFDPKEIIKSEYVPPIVITAFRKFDKAYSFNKSISEIKEIELSYNDYMFSFEFASLDYTYPENNQYAYKMEGLDKDWIQIGTRHFAAFTNLSPGKYIFRVKGTNSDGKWNNTGTSIIIIIKPPFWQMWWFRTIAALCVGLFLFYSYKLRIKKIEEQNIKLEKLVNERTMELSTEISIRQRTEEFLRKSEERFRALIENATDAILILSSEMNVMYVSPAFYKIFGISQFETNHNAYEYIVSGDKEIIERKVNDLIKNDEEYDRAIFRAFNNNGNEMFLEAVITNQLANPGVIGVVLNIRDITERKKSEEALRQSEERYRHLVEHAPFAIALLSEDKFTFMNRAGLQIIGFKNLSEIIGKSVLEFINHDSIPGALDRIKKIKRNPSEAISFEEKFITNSGREIIVEVAAISFTIMAERILQMVFQDISTRRKMEDELRTSEAELKELNYSKDQLFSIIAHDLKSPFSSLLGYSELLISDYSRLSTDEIRNSINVLNKSIRKIYKLVENLLEWSRMQTDRIEFNPSITEMKLLASQAISFLEVNALNKRVTLINNIPDDAYVYCDENMIISVFQNLISNAIKFTNKGGSITVSANEFKEYYEISVADNGIGIEADYLDKLFRIDFHHSTLGTGDEKGTGLGLILCKELIEKNSGEIRAESKVGKGSTFIFTLLKPSTSFNEN